MRAVLLSVPWQNRTPLKGAAMLERELPIPDLAGLQPACLLEPLGIG